MSPSTPCSPIRIPPARRRSRRRGGPAIGALATLTATVVLLAGCGSGSSDGSDSSTSNGCAPETTSGRDGVKLLPVPPATVTVLDAGGGARRVAAAGPDLTAPQQVTLLTNSTVRAATGTEEQSVELPMSARFGCTDPTDVEITLGRATSTDSTLAESLTPVDGSLGGLAIGPGLMPISLRLLPAEKAGPDARLAVEQSLLQALQKSVPLPTTPIAVGARWKVERTISAAATLTQTIEARLESWEGNRLVLAVNVDETPVNSVFAVPGTGSTLTINRFSSSGTGRLTVDLTRGLPVDGTINVSGARELVGSDPNAPLIQQTGLSVTWRATT